MRAQGARYVTMSSVDTRNEISVNIKTHTIFYTRQQRALRATFSDSLWRRAY